MYLIKTKHLLILEFYLMAFQDLNNLKLLNNPFACCSLINFDYLLPHIAHFDKIIVLPLVVFETFGFMLSVFFLHFKQYDNIPSL